MKCIKCNKNEASVFLERNINGKVTKTALCSKCAKESGITQNDLFGGFNMLGGFFDFPLVSDLRNEKAKKCPVCGEIFDNIVNSGMVGCAKCYETFENELSPTIKRLHGNVRHVASRAKKAKRNKESDVNEKNVKKYELSELKDRLKKAVKNEEYEQAAKLRDEIRAMEERKDG